MDKKVWEEDGFTLEVMPMWRCPFCDNAILKIHKNQHGMPIFYYDETITSLPDHNQFYPYKAYRFIGMLQCPRCKEIISFSGNGGVESIPVLNECGEPRAVDSVNTFYPKSFTPAIHIFSIPAKCLKDVRKIIIDSFNLFWVDSASCANKIRAAIESLLTTLGIRIMSKSHKYKTLRARMEEYEKTNPEVGEILAAIK